MTNAHLTTYLNDHLAGAWAALELLEDLQSAHPQTALADILAGLEVDIRMDHEELEALALRLRITPSRLRRAGAWLGEKLARLKLKLDDPSGGVLRQFEALEALSLGIEGKRILWQTLATIADSLPELQDMDYDRLIRRADDQRRRVEAIRLEAAREAFGAFHAAAV